MPTTTTRKRRNSPEVDVYVQDAGTTRRIGHFTRGRFQRSPYDVNGRALEQDRPLFPGDVTYDEGTVDIVVREHLTQACHDPGCAGCVGHCFCTAEGK